MYYVDIIYIIYTKMRKENWNKDRLTKDSLRL